MARKKQDEALDPVADTTDEDAPEFDSTFEEAQQMLQATVAEIRAWEPPVDYVEAHGTAEELGAHRRWRRRRSFDTGEHLAVPTAEAAAAADQLDDVASNGAEVDDHVEVEVYEVAEADELPFEVAEPEELAFEAEELPFEIDEVEVAEVEVAEVEVAEVEVADPVEAEAEAEVAEIEVEEVDPAPEVVVVADERPDDAPVAGVATAEVDVVEVAAAGVAADAVHDAAATTDAPADDGSGDDSGDWDQTALPALDSPGPESKGRRRRRQAAAAAAAAVAAGDDLADIDATYEKRTARRRRDHAGHLATIDSPTADYVLTMDTIDPIDPAPDTTAAPTSNRSRRLLVAALVAVVVVAGIGVALVASGGNDEVASPPAKVKPRLEFPVETTPDGVQVDRVWKLAGAEGTDFTGTVKLTNTTAAPVTTTYTEVIPKAIASSVTAVTFTPQPTTVVKADPVVQWTETVEPGKTFSASYAVTVPPAGATRQRLLKWQEDRDAEAGTTTTTTLPPTPTTEAPTTTTPVNTSPPSATTAPPVTAPTTTAPPPPPTTTAPPADGSIWISVFNTGTGPDATFNFSNGYSVTVPSGQQVSSGYFSVPPGTVQVSLLNGTTANITCSPHGSGSGNTATYEVSSGGDPIGCTWSASVP